MKRFKTIKPTVKVKYRYGDRTEVSHVDLEDEVEGLTVGTEENENEVAIDCIEHHRSILYDNIDDTVDAVGISCFEAESDNSESEADNTVTVSSYQRKKERRCSAWERLRQNALRVATENEGAQFVKTRHCINCSSTDEAMYRCKECGPFSFFCENCAVELHKRSNVLHRVEILKNGIYYPSELEREMKWPHSCTTTSYTRRLAVVKATGYQCSVSVTFCQCEREFLQLLRLELWGATPTRPSLAFSLGFMELLHSLNLECQVALKDFSNAIQFLETNKILSQHHQKIYPTIIDAFEEYRYFRHKLRTKSFLVHELDDGNVCPSCPKEVGTICDSMDALFIGRKKAAGTSARPPLFGNTVFYDQETVDAFVRSCDGEDGQLNTNTLNPNDAKGCNNFLAGNAVRSRARYTALSETAVFGRACRHEFPKMFLNLKHGERLSYALWNINDILTCLDDKPNIEMNVLYDVACMLTLYLQNRGLTDALERIHYAIPIFHVYGHKGICQIKYSPRRLTGFGLTDGEVLERLWSYLRRFGKMTKEMRPSHRIDVLSDAILHYGASSIAKLENLLDSRMKKAKQLKCEVLEELTQMLETLSVKEDDIEQWANQQSNFMNASQNQPEESPWEEKYSIYLGIFYELEKQWASLNTKNADAALRTHNQIKTIEKTLQDIEVKNHVNPRWKESDFIFQETRQRISTKKQKIELAQIRSKVVERWFLLSLKSKYSDGQMLATRLSKQINRVTKDVRKRIDVYNKASNARAAIPSPPLPKTLQFDEISYPEAEIWATLEGLNPTPSLSVVPFKTKRRVIDLHFMVKRCEEEIDLLTSDMQECWLYFTRQREALVSAYSFLQDDHDLFNLGKQSLVLQQVMHVECKLLKLHRIFSAYISIQLPVLLLLNNDTSNDISDTDTHQQLENLNDVYILLPDSVDDIYSDSEEESIIDDDDHLVATEQILYNV